jgi:chromosomal replication initiator protein
LSSAAAIESLTLLRSSVVESPGTDANPLVLYGSVGTGKTHLLEGVYAGLRTTRPDWRLRFLAAEEFTNRFLHAMRHGKLGTFRDQFRDCDALLLDDVGFLVGKKATQEEFLHTFDALLSGGRQVVLTCDCHPRLADELSREIIDRLLGGAIWGVVPPDGATRLHILRHKGGQGDPFIPDEVLKFLAGKLRGNVRELEGALHSLRHYSRVADRPVDLDLAWEALGELLRHAIRVVRLDDVDRAVCQVLHFERGTLQSRERAWAVSHARMLAMFLARKHTMASFSEIGHFFGRRTHSTVVAAEKKIRRWLDDDKDLCLVDQRLGVRELTERIERELLR